MRQTAGGFFQPVSILLATVNVCLYSLGGQAAVGDPLPVEAANHFLSLLTLEQQAKAVVEDSAAERTRWHFLPRHRAGLALKEMSGPVLRDIAPIHPSRGIW